jgi:SpoIID/LytB domain protein
VRRLLVAVMVALVGVAPTAVASEVVPIAPAAFTLQGSGFGHGVGLSQYGALAMAKAGYDAASIATFYYPGTTVSPVQDDMDIRVNIDYRKPEINVRSEPLDPTGGAIEVNVGGTVTLGNAADVFRFANEGGNVRVLRVTGEAVADLGVVPSVVIKWAGTRDPGQAVGGPTVLNVVGPARNFASPGHRYRYGFVEITPTTGGLNAVNVVRMRDEYLYGIAEVSNSWPDAALQVQALAARTYALAKFIAGVRRACNCHVDDGSGPYTDQMFAGFAKESSTAGDRWVAAVNATHVPPNAGNAILFNGQPITAFYSSSSGGFTHASRDAWGGERPYAQVVADPWSLTEDNPNRTWSVTVPQQRIAAAFGVGEVRSLTIAERHPSGVPKAVVATMPDGSQARRSGGALQRALRLRSPYIQSIDGQIGAPFASPGAPAPPGAAPAPPPEAPPAPVYETTVELATGVSVNAPALENFEITARVLPGEKGRMVWRQQQVGEEWVTIDKARTDRKGRVTFATKKPWPPGQVTAERLLVVRKGQPIGLSDQMSVTVVPSVAPRTVVLKTPTAIEVRAGKSVTITARIRPRSEGIVVVRQALSGDQWVTVDRARTNAKGRVTFTIKKAKPSGATYTYRLVAVERRQAAGASPEIIVTVR